MKPSERFQEMAQKELFDGLHSKPRRYGYRPGGEGSDISVVFTAADTARAEQVVMLQLMDELYERNK